MATKKTKKKVRPAVKRAKKLIKKAITKPRNLAFVPVTEKLEYKAENVALIISSSVIDLTVNGVLQVQWDRNTGTVTALTDFRKQEEVQDEVEEETNVIEGQYATDDDFDSATEVESIEEVLQINEERGKEFQEDISSAQKTNDWEKQS